MTQPHANPLPPVAPALHPTFRHVAHVGFIMLSLLAVTGCGQKGSELTFTSLDNDARFVHRFPDAFISRGDQGDFDLALVEDGLTRAAQASGPHRPLEPATASPRQIVHIKMVWKPMPGTKPDHPAATNAVVNWYVLGSGGGSDTSNLLHYAGSGFVRVRMGRSAATVDLRNVRLELKERRGNMTDPLGNAALTGTFEAKVSPGNVSALLAEARQALQNDTTTAAPDPIRSVEPQPGPPVRAIGP